MNRVLRMVINGKSAGDPALRSAVMALRTRRKEAFQKRHGVNLGLSSFFVKASLGALRVFPRLNAEVRERAALYERTATGLLRYHHGRPTRPRPG